MIQSMIICIKAKKKTRKLVLTNRKRLLVVTAMDQTNDLIQKNK